MTYLRTYIFTVFFITVKISIKSTKCICLSLKPARKNAPLLGGTLVSGGSTPNLLGGSPGGTASHTWCRTSGLTVDGACNAAKPQALSAVVCEQQLWNHSSFYTDTGHYQRSSKSLSPPMVDHLRSLEVDVTSRRPGLPVRQTVPAGLNLAMNVCWLLRQCTNVYIFCHRKF